MIVPLSAGTTTDIVARTIADRLGQRLGQPVVVENKQGAGGLIAAQAALSSAPDGYTILMVNSQHVINPAVNKSLPYDTLRDFVGLALVGEAPSVVVVTPTLGVRTLKDFIALAKQRPDSINYASGGIGSQTHLAGAYFASQAGISMVHIPYKVSSEVVGDLLTGRVQVSFVPAAFLLGPIREGKLLAACHDIAHRNAHASGTAQRERCGHPGIRVRHLVRLRRTRQGAGAGRCPPRASPAGGRRRT